MDTARSSLWTDLAAALSLGAGLVHAAAAGSHSGDSVVVALFAATAIAQVWVGATLLTGPTRRSLLVGATVSTAAVAAWTASRTVGLPIVDSLAGREAVGAQDTIAAVLGAGAVLFVVVATMPHPPFLVIPRLRWLPALVVLPVLIGVTATHHHEGDEVATASIDHHDRDAGSGDGAPQDETAHADPMLAGADTSHATQEEVDEAVALITFTRSAVDPHTTDTAAAERAGYVWIGDGRRAGGFQHYLNPAFLEDGLVLDPDRIEALVFENTADGPMLVTAMYVLERGSTMADVPETGGDLTVWHDHQNLCWDESGTKLVGISTDGKTCRPGGVLQATPPMLHVWLEHHDCGPFAGLDGHGSTGCSAHGD